MSVPAYVEARIRRPRPAGLPVVPGSTPIIPFGDVRKAKIATLGLNPSKSEFLGRDGKELMGANRRLETLLSLGERDLSSAAAGSILRVFQGCNNYSQRRPFRKWFNVLEKILRPLGASYYDGTACSNAACHLDLVQWATDPAWGELRDASKKRLLEGDFDFLGEQLSHENITVLLLNGASVVKSYRRKFRCELIERSVEGAEGLEPFCGSEVAEHKKN